MFAAKAMRRSWLPAKHKRMLQRAAAFSRVAASGSAMLTCGFQGLAPMSRLLWTLYPEFAVLALASCGNRRTSTMPLIGGVDAASTH